MKSETLVTTLTSLTTAMAVMAPFVVFGFLYVMRVQPEQSEADRLRLELATIREQVNHQRPGVAPTGSKAQSSALDEFNARIPQANRAAQLRAALGALLNGPEVGGVSHLSIDSEAPAPGSASALVRPFSAPVLQVPVTVAFDARYEQIGRFFSNLPEISTPFDIQSVELVPLPSPSSGMMRVKVSLLAFERGPAPESPEAPRRSRVAVSTNSNSRRDPVVSGIVFSSGRRVALVDGVMVSQGDRVGSSVVLSIEQDAVTFAEAGGAARRVAISRPHPPVPNR